MDICTNHWFRSRGLDDPVKCLAGDFFHHPGRSMVRKYSATNWIVPPFLLVLFTSEVQCPVWPISSVSSSSVSNLKLKSDTLTLVGYQGLREGKRHLIPFPRVGKRQSLIPFPRVGKSFHEPEEFDDDVAIDDTFPMSYPTGSSICNIPFQFKSDVIFRDSFHCNVFRALLPQRSHHILFANQNKRVGFPRGAA